LYAPLIGALGERRKRPIRVGDTALGKTINHLLFEPAFVTIALNVAPSKAAKTAFLTAASSRAQTGGRSLHNEHLARLQAALIEPQRFQVAATLLCTELAVSLGAKRVAIGWCSKTLNPSGLASIRCEPVALSHSTQTKLDPALKKLLAHAMTEAIDQSASTHLPKDASGQLITVALHELWMLGRGAAFCIPLASARTCVGALTIEFSAQDLAKWSDLESLQALQESLASYAQCCAPILEWQSQNDQSLWKFWRHRRQRNRAIDDAQRERSTNVHSSLSRRQSRYAWTTLLALASAFIGLVPVQHTISAPVRIEAQQQIQVAVPIRATIKSVAVRPGDAVVKGQILAELAERDLELERDKTRSELAQHQSAYSAAIAKADRPAMMIAQSRIAESQAQLSLTDAQIDRVQLRAPIDGIVLAGDLSQLLGTPVERGQTLFTIGPALKHRAIIEVEERDIAALTRLTKQPALIQLSALPTARLAFTVQRQSPTTQQLESRNVLELEAIANFETNSPSKNTQELIKPGMRGVALLRLNDRALLAQWWEQISVIAQRWWWQWGVHV
jgi:multidrug resistance efflux pump